VWSKCAAIALGAKYRPSAIAARVARTPNVFSIVEILQCFLSLSSSVSHRETTLDS